MIKYHCPQCGSDGWFTERGFWLAFICMTTLALMTGWAVGKIAYSEGVRSIPAGSKP
jgi:hypothetical protein